MNPDVPSIDVPGVKIDWPEAPPLTRDQLAAMAMQGLAVNAATSGRTDVKALAVAAYRIADAMLVERSRR